MIIVVRILAGVLLLALAALLGQDYRLWWVGEVAGCLEERSARSGAWGEVVGMKTFEASHSTSRTRPLMGLRRRPGRLALAVFRVPLPLYRAGWGWLLGRTFLLLVHAGRKTGQPHAMTAMVLRYDAVTHEAVICSGWGPTTDWVRNIRARPALEVRIGRESFTPQQRFLSEDESFDVCLEFACATRGACG